MHHQTLAQICVIAALLGSELILPVRGAGIPPAPIGHRQPSAADVPSDDSVEGWSSNVGTPNGFGPALKSLPKLDIRATCRRAQPLGPGDEDAYQSCLRDEIAAQRELSHKWFSFKAGARAICTQETHIGGAPSFVELMTCLELDQQAAQSRMNNVKPLGSSLFPAVSMTPPSAYPRALSRN
jgi:hypothetical protein